MKNQNYLSPVKVRMMKFSLIMPVYNEEKFLKLCLDSLMKQTIKPDQIIIVDDGSTDRSPEIIKQYSGTIVLTLPKQKNSMIERVPYVMKAGTQLLDEDFDYVGNLDADTVLEPQYYEKLLNEMEKDKKIGIAGGKLIGQPEGKILGLIPYVYGCNRLYSRKCWFKINGGKNLKPVPTWDTYHNIYAQMLGFKALRFDYIHSWALRPAGLGKNFSKGFQSYQLGYFGVFLLLRAIKDRSPKLLAGYLKAMACNEKQYPVKPYIRQLQAYRLKKLARSFL